jgi:hypothetical protein
MTIQHQMVGLLMNGEKLVNFLLKVSPEFRQPSSVTGQSLKESIRTVIAVHLVCSISFPNIVISKSRVHGKDGCISGKNPGAQ